MPVPVCVFKFKSRFNFEVISLSHGHSHKLVRVRVFKKFGGTVTVLVFGLWRIRFPPVLVRTGRRLPVQALGERGVLVSLTGYPRGGAPGPG